MSMIKLLAIRAAISCLFISICALASGKDAGTALEASARSLVAIDYADTLQGVSALLAVRVCVANGFSRTGTSLQRGPESATTTRSLIVEHVVETEHDVVVRVIDRDGIEIVRHEGAKDVCGFAHLAAAYLAQDRAVSDRGAP